MFVNEAGEFFGALDRDDVEVFDDGGFEAAEEIDAAAFEGAGELGRWEGVGGSFLGDVAEGALAGGLEGEVAEGGAWWGGEFAADGDDAVVFDEAAGGV